MIKLNLPISGLKMPHSQSFFSSSAAQMIIIIYLQTEESGRGLAVFSDETLPVDNLSKKYLINAEGIFLEFTLGKLMYLVVCIYHQPNTIEPDFISVITSFFYKEKALLFKKLLIVADINIPMLLTNHASRNWIFLE